MAVSVQVGSSLLEINDGVTYAVATDTLYALTAGDPSEPKMIEMASRYPAYGGIIQKARTVPLLVFLLRRNALDRRADFDTLLAALDNGSGLVQVQWTEDLVTKRYLCHVSALTSTQWFTRASADLTAPNPTPEIV